MSWSETKKISDVIKSIVTPNEIISARLEKSAPYSVQGCGIAYLSSYVLPDNGKLTVDGIDIESKSFLITDGEYHEIRFSKSLYVINNSYRSYITVYLFNREFIGGGYRRKLVPFSIRKAVAA